MAVGTSSCMHLDANPAASERGPLGVDVLRAYPRLSAFAELADATAATGDSPTDLVFASIEAPQLNVAELDLMALALQRDIALV